MHEMGITESILSVVLAESAKRGGKKVSGVVLEIGELTNIVADSIEFYFELMAKGTAAEGARLESRLIPLEAKCEICKKRRKIENLDFICACGGNMKTIQGKELAIVSIEIEGAGE